MEPEPVDVHTHTLTWRLAAAMLVTLLSLGVLSPALAENHRNTYMKEVAVGFVSKTWQDEQNDSVATKISNKYCSLTYPQVHAYSSHNLELQRKKNLGWTSYGARTSHCDTVSWGSAVKGTWRFRVSQINSGNKASYQRLSVDALVIYW